MADMGTIARHILTLVVSALLLTFCTGSEPTPTSSTEPVPTRAANPIADTGRGDQPGLPPTQGGGRQGQGPGEHAV